MTDPPEKPAAWPPSSLLQYLPAIYHEKAFLGQFLLAFEKLLFGRDDDVTLQEKPPPAFDWLIKFADPWLPGQLLLGREDCAAAPPALERQISGIAAYWIPCAIKNDPLLPVGDDIPREAPDEFLPWLASWTAFTLRFDLDEAQQREFIAKAIPLYRHRGTKASLVDLLRIFTIGQPTVEDTVSGQCTEGSITHRTLTVGGSVTGTWAPGQLVSGGTTAANTYIERQATGHPCGAGTYDVSVSQTVVATSLASEFDVHCFTVTIRWARHETAVQQRQIEIANAIVELEKPAHTSFRPKWEFPGMQIGEHSYVGVDTIIGTAQSEGRA
jgi:hypothetical protein